MKFKVEFIIVLYYKLLFIIFKVEFIIMLYYIDPFY
jgi:hypothetical protein